MKFKIGDKVKGCYGEGTIIAINSKNKNEYCVEHNNIWVGGHDGNGVDDVLGKKQCCWWYLEQDMSLIKKGKYKSPKEKEKMLAIIKDCNNLRLITDLKDINEDATIYKLVPFLKIEKKTIMRRTYLNKKKKR